MNKWKLKEVASQWQRSDLWEDQESSQQLYNQMETSKKKLMMKLQSDWGQVSKENIPIGFSKICGHQSW